MKRLGPKSVVGMGALAIGLALAFPVLWHEDPPCAVLERESLPRCLVAAVNPGAPVGGATTPGAAATADQATRDAAREPASPVDAASDREWASLPRVTKDVLGRLLQTQRCDPVQLYRSHQCNPRDLWLSPTVRVAIAAMARDGATRIERLRAAAVTVKHDEFARSHAAGKALPVDLATLEGRTNLGRVGASAVFGEVEGLPFAAASVEMPQTIAADRALRQAAGDLAAHLLAAFAEHGALQAAEVEVLRARLR